jgi:hypothetical protein
MNVKNEKRNEIMAGNKKRIERLGKKGNRAHIMERGIGQENKATQMQNPSSI